MESAGAVYPADGSGVTQVLKRLEARAARNRTLANKLEQQNCQESVAGPVFLTNSSSPEIVGRDRPKGIACVRRHAPSPSSSHSPFDDSS